MKSRASALQTMDIRHNLLKIPREIRDEILALVLTYRRPTPRTPAEVEAQNRQVPTEGSNGYSIPGVSGFYLSDENAYAANGAGLLLTNKQIRREAQEALRRLDITTEIDFKFINEQYLAPTWTVLPEPTKRFKRVRAVFQSIGSRQQPPQESKYEYCRPWKWGCGGPPSYVWIFYNILVHFLEYGAAAPSTTSGSGIVSVEHLELDFVDPEDTSLLPEDKERTLWDAIRHPQDPRKAELLRSKWLARDLYDQMLFMFGMDYHSSSYAKIFHGRIGHMLFKVNGEVIAEIDVGQLLALLEFNDSFGDIMRDYRVQTWIDWREEAQGLRKRFGFKTVEFSSSWQEEARARAMHIYGERCY